MTIESYEKTDNVNNKIQRWILFFSLEIKTQWNKQNWNKQTQCLVLINNVIKKSYLHIAICFVNYSYEWNKQNNNRMEQWERGGLVNYTANPGIQLPLLLVLSMYKCISVQRRLFIGTIGNHYHWVSALCVVLHEFCSSRPSADIRPITNSLYTS